MSLALGLPVRPIHAPQEQAIQITRSLPMSSVPLRSSPHRRCSSKKAVNAVSAPDRVSGSSTARSIAGGVAVRNRGFPDLVFEAAARLFPGGPPWSGVTERRARCRSRRGPPRDGELPRADVHRLHTIEHDRDGDSEGEDEEREAERVAQHGGHLYVSACKSACPPSRKY